MQRYKAIIAYDGSGFSGYQIQPRKRTVQQAVEMVLQKMHNGSPVKIFASGRTDAGVHAKGQVIHFDSLLPIPEQRWEAALNSLLPEDISVISVTQVDPAFHARFAAVGKEYRYMLHLSKVRDPFQRDFAYRYPYPLNLQAIENAAQYLIGTHDFTSFCSAKTESEDKIRTIHTIELLENGDFLTLRFIGSGFLYNMVRILVGTLIEVGNGDRSPEDIPMILDKKDRRFAGKTAPAHGLYLWQVFYQ